MNVRHHPFVSVGIHDNFSIPYVSDPGILVYDSFWLKYGSYEISRGGLFDDESYSYGQRWYPDTGWIYENIYYNANEPEDLVLVPELEGLIPRPFISNADPGMHKLYSSGEWGQYYSDNDNWGYYDEATTSGAVSATYCDPNSKDVFGNVTGMGSFSGFACNIRWYERASRTTSSETLIDFSPYSIYIPSSGSPSLNYNINRVVKVFDYEPNAATATDSVTVVCLLVGSKLVVTLDDFANSYVYDPLVIGGSRPAAFRGVNVVHRGRRAQFSVKKVSFRRGGRVRVKRQFNFRNNGSALSVESLEDNSGLRYGNNRQPVIQTRGLVWEGATRAEIAAAGSGAFRITAAHSGKDGEVLYGVLWKAEPILEALSAPSYTEVRSDVGSVTLECPPEFDNTTANVQLHNIDRDVVTAAGITKNKYKYSHVSNLSNYKLGHVTVGFYLRDTGTGELSVDPINTRTIYGLIDTISHTQDGKFDFKLNNGAQMLKETMCDGRWGPWDGLFVAEALENLCHECGIVNLLVKGYKANDPTDDIITPATYTWFTVDQILANSHAQKIMTRLSYGTGKEPKWKPRAGDNGWSVAQELAAYDSGLFYIGDNLTAYYDPFYFNDVTYRLYTFTGEYGVPITEVVQLPYDFNDDVVLNLSAVDLAPNDYTLAAPVSTNLAGDKLAKSILVLGQVQAGGRNYKIGRGAVNPNAVVGGSMFIPFTKRLVVLLKSLDNVNLISKMLDRYIKRLFSVPREFNIETACFPQLRPTQIVTYYDKNVEGTLGSGGNTKAYVMVENCSHAVNIGGDNVWGKTTIQGSHVAYQGGRFRDVKV